MLHETDRPLLKRFGEDGVVREEERVAGDLPGLVPWNVLLVDKDAHELGDGERRVRLGKSLVRQASDSTPLSETLTSLS